MAFLNILLDNFKAGSGTDVAEVLSNIPIGKADLSNVIKAGLVVVTDDAAQTFSFDEAFTGNASDIYVVVTRMLPNASAAFSVTATTLTGFDINRNDDVTGSQNTMYIAINMGALKNVPVYG